MQCKRGNCAYLNYLYSLMTPVSLYCHERGRARDYLEHLNRIRLFQRSLTREEARENRASDWITGRNRHGEDANTSTRRP